MWTLSADVALSQAVSQSDAARLSREGRYPLTRPYETSDGRWIQLMFLDPQRYWPELCRRVERSELLRDPRFVDGEHRAEHGDALSAEFANAFRRKTLVEWRAAFEGWDAPWEMVQTINEVATDPQAVANGYLFKVQVADGTDVTVVAGPVAFNGSAIPAEPRCAPSLGQHSDELLRSIGVSPEHLRDLKQRNIVR
jgi:crotonobetainyl-CoA:carnitine CoA-transferase CaiB-like acyl-CoA transferase